MEQLSSRERLRLVLRYQEPDHVPLLFKTFGFEPPPAFRWSNAIEEARAWLSAGVDAWLDVRVPMRFHPDVRVRQRLETPKDRPWPVAIKEYETPAGVFRQEVYRTDDWVSPDWPMHRDGSGGLDLFDDYNVARYRSPPIEVEKDLEKLRYLLHPLSGGALSDFRERTAATARQAQELGVLLVGHGSSGTDAAIWLCGVDKLLFMAMDRPDMFSALLDIIHEWDKRNVEVLLDTSVDLIMRRGYYEGSSFWSPALYRKFFLPRIKELADMAHQADRFMGYTMSVGFMPLLDTLVEIAYDAHYLLDPVSGGGRVDLAKVKSVLNGKIAVIGGLNAPITLGRGTREQIRQEVFDAVQMLGSGGGLALTPAEAIYASTPWDSVAAVIDAWKEVRDYPIAAAPTSKEAWE